MQSMLRLKRGKNIQSVPFDLRELAKHLFFFKVMGHASHTTEPFAQDTSPRIQKCLFNNSDHSVNRKRKLFMQLQS